jgi:Zn-dependent protease
VPVAFWQLWNPRWGMVLVAAAGPAINFALALGFGLAAYQLRSNADSFSPPVADWLWLFALRSLEINVILACFNLLPVLPLDGGRILLGLLPAPIARLFAATERYGLLLVIGVLFIAPLLFEGFRPLETFVSFIAAPIGNALLTFTGLR